MNPIAAKTFRLGGALEVNRLGYGAMRLTGQPGNFGSYANWEVRHLDENVAAATIELTAEEMQAAIADHR